MTDSTRAFTVASDAALVDLIRKAQSRLAVIAPALTKQVADALVARLGEQDQLYLTVVLDADPEVYRLGYGDPEALEIIRSASVEAQFDLREQQGVRIGVVISDETTMIFAPVSRNIEAGSTTEEKPNAVLLCGPATERLAQATGIAEGETEIGQQGLEPSRVVKMLANLKANPPKPFDIARRLNVFTSRVQYVEFKVSNYRLNRRQIKLPDDFVGVDDTILREQISGRIRAPFETLGKMKLLVKFEDNLQEMEIDEKSLEKERRSIEDDFTYPLAHHGRIILREDRDRFDKKVKRFETIVEAYHAALKDRFEEAREGFKKRLREEFTPRWKANPPARFLRWGYEKTEGKIRIEIDKLADKVFDEALVFDPPLVRVNYKGIAFENIMDADFVANLKAIMEKREVPTEILATLFETGVAAPASEAFRNT
jgi:hypothetical protein